MVKVKRVRTIDAVVLGWRPGKAERTVGALILGLYDGDRLREVGHSSGFTAKEKRELVDFLAPYETGERGSGEASRWNSSRPPATWSGSPCVRSSSSRSPSTTSPTGASATGPRSSAGARTSPRRRAPWTSSTSRVGQ